MIKERYVNDTKGLKIENVVTIELIDKATGKVIDRTVAKNAVGETGAGMLITIINGTISEEEPYKDWKYIHLFDSNKSKIKTLTGTWSYATRYSGYFSATLTAQDTSTDSYTTVYQGISPSSIHTSILQMCLWQNITRTKASNQTLNISWEVRVAFTAYP